MEHPRRKNIPANQCRPAPCPTSIKSREVVYEPFVHNDNLHRPPAYFSSLVGGVVVHHQVQILIRIVVVDLAQKAQELLPTVLRFHRPGGDLESCERCGRSMPLVVVDVPLGVTDMHRQRRRSAFQRLYLDFSSTHNRIAFMNPGCWPSRRDDQWITRTSSVRG